MKSYGVLRALASPVLMLTVMMLGLSGFDKAVAQTGPAQDPAPGLAYTTQGQRTTTPHHTTTHHMGRTSDAPPKLYNTRTIRSSSAPDQQGGMRHKVLKYDDPAKADDAAPPSADELAAERVWKKYRALAAGQYEDEQPKETTAPRTISMQQPQEVMAKDVMDGEAVQNIAPSSGLTGILQEYKRNKQQRSQMRMITVSPDQPDEPAQPSQPDQPATPIKPTVPDAAAQTKQGR